MKFSIITPTYRRSDKLARAVSSVIEQTHSDWEMIIVNDSPDDHSYESFKKTISDARIQYFKNEQNSGVNFSRNSALDNVSKNSDWIIFLDDDDYLSPDTLSTFASLAQKYPENNWFITNRVLSNGTPTTSFPKPDTAYNYAWDYLITKRCKGDATHCIRTTLARNIRFSKLINQAEEWIFFYQIGLKSKIFYHNHNSTITDGYDTVSGLNFRKRTRREQLKTLLLIIHESWNLSLLYHPTFCIYLHLRFIRLGTKD